MQPSIRRIHILISKRTQFSLAISPQWNLLTHTVLRQYYVIDQF